ncbi:heavy-metal-associated domain-containing protein [Chitinophaga rhizophila]|uniref:Heavy-metal-associated domain-containing protein n=1 Tax=Chitinophaga rhizophila TaxID=2866212 RepID=A0ABS7GJT5_9BACT|nr:heavy-metal-associated domain-containing protein [Chitinophaga rhizophila]MBW8687450.1 heavy-metal-associated domain-containing protein [Chitinophaga rhizophila]
MEQQFKTNIKCGGCITTVTPFLNAVVGEHSWKVDTAVPEKVLTISNGAVTADKVIEAVKQAGFKAEQF